MLRNGLDLNGEVNACFLISSYRTSGLHIISITMILMLYAFAFHASALNEYSISISRYIPFKMRYFLIGLLTIYSIILRALYFSCLIFIWFNRFFLYWFIVYAIQTPQLAICISAVPWFDCSFIRYFRLQNSCLETISNAFIKPRNTDNSKTNIECTRSLRLQAECRNERNQHAQIEHPFVCHT